MDEKVNKEYSGGDGRQECCTKEREKRNTSLEAAKSLLHNFH